MKVSIVLLVILTIFPLASAHGDHYFVANLNCQEQCAETEATFGRVVQLYGQMDSGHGVEVLCEIGNESKLALAIVDGIRRSAECYYESGLLKKPLYFYIHNIGPYTPEPREQYTQTTQEPAINHARPPRPDGLDFLNIFMSALVGTAGFNRLRGGLNGLPKDDW
jgi:hypothetical protein